MNIFDSIDMESLDIFHEYLDDCIPCLATKWV